MGFTVHMNFDLKHYDRDRLRFFSTFENNYCLHHDRYFALYIMQCIYPVSYISMLIVHSTISDSRQPLHHYCHSLVLMAKEWLPIQSLKE